MAIMDATLGKAQPGLPKLANNGQRKEWLRNYQDWGLWYKDENIGVSYYRYIFKNGAVLVAEEYETEFRSVYFHLIGGPESPMGKYGARKWQRHERYSRYPNSESELIEFLKEVQKE